MAAAPLRCAVTGAAGYVGSAIVRACRARAWSVLSLGRRAAPGATAHCPYDLCSDARDLPWRDVDALVHAAWDLKAQSWERIQHVNVEGSLRLFQQARAHGVKRLIFISSLSAFPDCRSLYGRAKLLVEEAVLQMGGAVIRPGLVHGKTPGSMVAALTAAVSRSPIVPLIGDGSFVQYLVHDEDLGNLAADLCLPSAPSIPRPISAAHPQGVSFRRLLEILARQQGKSPRFVKIPWQLIHAGLVTLEALRLPAPFRSDSLIGFVFQNPAPNFSLPELPQTAFRPFE